MAREPQFRKLVLDGAPADNEVLAFNSGDSTWKNQTAAEAGLAALSGATFTGYIVLHITDSDGSIEASLWYDASEDKLKFKTAAGVETITSS